MHSVLAQMTSGGWTAKEIASLVSAGVLITVLWLALRQMFKVG